MPLADLATEPVYDHLVLVEGHLSGNRLPLKTPCILIGSDANCDIWLPHDGIKPWHTVLALTDRGWYAKVLDPSGPMLVNGVPVAAAWLNPGDRLGFGRIIMVMQPIASSGSSVLANLTTLRSSLRVHASAISAAHMELHRQQGKLEAEKQRWRLRCRQIAKELNRRQAKLRKTSNEVQASGDNFHEKKPNPTSLLIGEFVAKTRDIGCQSKIKNTVYSPYLRDQRRRMARLHWVHRLRIAKRFSAWEKNLLLSESELSKGWAVLLSRHEKYEADSREFASSLHEREQAFNARLSQAELSLQHKEKSVRASEMLLVAENKRISLEGTIQRQSQQDWLKRLADLHQEETGLKRRIENLTLRLPETCEIVENNGPDVTRINNDLGLTPPGWIGILHETLAILAAQRQILLSQGEAMAVRDCEWMREQRSSVLTLEAEFVRLAHQDHLLLEKHSVLDFQMEQVSNQSESLAAQLRSFKFQQRQELESIAETQTRIAIQERFIHNRKDRLESLETEVTKIVDKEIKGLAGLLESANEIIKVNESHEVNLICLHDDMKKALAEYQPCWQNLAFERAELEFIGMQIARKKSPESIQSRLKEARLCAGERTAIWIRLMETQRRKLEAERESAILAWRNCTKLLEKIKKTLEPRLGLLKDHLNQSVAGIRYREEAAFWQEEFQRIQAELAALKKCDHNVDPVSEVNHRPKSSVLKAA